MIVLKHLFAFFATKVEKSWELEDRSKEFFCTFAPDFGKRTMKRYTLHYIFQFLGAIFTLLFVACASESQWNDIEFYKVEKQEQLSESPLDDTDEENTEDEDSVEDKFTQLHTGLKREMDVKVDMQFLKSDKDTNERVCQLINAQLIEILLHQSSELSADEAVAQYIDDVKGEFHSDEVADIYRDHLTGRAEYGMGQVINYRLVEEAFNGGAHPCIVTTILRFNTKTGEMITADNLFPATKKDQLKEMLLRRLMENQHVRSLDELHKKGILEMTDMFVSNNIALREDSIEFHYNEYDIAPYSYGTFTICLGYDEAKEVMNADQTVKP